MADIVILGRGPLPGPETSRIDADSLRTWQFARAAADTPHTAHVFTLPGPGEAPKDNAPKIAEIPHEGFTCHAIQRNDRRFAAAGLKKYIDLVRPSCLVGVSAAAASILAELPSRAPLWADLCDNGLAAAQALARQASADEAIEQAWRDERAVWLRADKFSCGSMPRLHALLGALGACGRLNRFTAQWHFAHHIPLAAHPLFARPSASTREPLRPQRVPEDAFAVLWIGAFDEQCDVDTLFEGLELAMAANPKIHFVSAGGQAGNLEEPTYRRFLALVEKSEHPSRYHLLGWVDVHELPALCRECDLGVCVDAMQYETLFGVRLRILAMLAAGLPVACALGSEISHILQEEEIGLVFPAGSAEDFADAIVRASQRPTEIRALGQRGRNHATRYFTVAEQTRAFAEWVDRPALAPDNAEKARRAGGLELFQDVALNAIQETFARLGGDDIRDLVQAKIDVDAIRAKWWYDLGRRAKRSSLAALRKARIVRPQ